MTQDEKYELTTEVTKELEPMISRYLAASHISTDDISSITMQSINTLAAIEKPVDSGVLINSLNSVLLENSTFKLPLDAEKYDPAQETIAKLCVNSMKHTLASINADEPPRVSITFPNIPEFKILGVAGAGAFAKVFKAVDNQHRICALKVGKLHNPKRFNTEVQALKNITHNRLVDYFDSGIVTIEGQQNFWISMEYVSSWTLRNLLEAAEFDIAETLLIAEQIFDGLAVLHEQGIIHHDLKPENILVAQNCQTLKLVDFGLSKAADQDKSMSLVLAVTGKLIGTPNYMSPEQVEGTTEITPAIDVWAFGVILFEMFTGTLPFMGNIMQLGASIKHDTPDYENSRIPHEFRDFLKKLLSKNTDQRPQNGAEALQQFRNIAEPFLQKYYYEKDRENWFKIIENKVIQRFAEIHEGEYSQSKLNEFFIFADSYGITGISHKSRLEKLLKQAFKFTKELKNTIADFTNYRDKTLKDCDTKLAAKNQNLDETKQKLASQITSQTTKLSAKEIKQKTEYLEKIEIHIENLESDKSDALSQCIENIENAKVGINKSIENFIKTELADALKDWEQLQSDIAAEQERVRQAETARKNAEQERLRQAELEKKIAYEVREQHRKDKRKDLIYVSVSFLIIFVCILLGMILSTDTKTDYSTNQSNAPDYYPEKPEPIQPVEFEDEYDTSNSTGKIEKLIKAGFEYLGVKEYKADCKVGNNTETIKCTVAEYKYKDAKTGFEMEFVLLPPLESSAPENTGVYPSNAKFTMGSPEDEEDSYSDERPPHKVELTPFLVAKTETTQKQWDAIKKLGGIEDDREWTGDNLPIENVSWDDCQNFLTKLNNLARSFLETAGNSRDNDDVGSKIVQFSLPTEAQWEFACRAGTTTPFYFGDSLSSEQANFNGNYPSGSASKAVYRRKTTEVKTFDENAFGLFDMHGNVWEWCQDCWDSDFYDSSKSSLKDFKVSGTNIFRNPVCSSGSGSRVLRGGSWHDYGYNCRSAYRYYYDAGGRGNLIGFRCAFILPELP